MLELPLILSDPFPRGIAQYVVGGGLIGLGVAVIYLGTAILPGASTFLESSWSYVSRVPRFNRAKYITSRDWRVVFTAGIILGALAWTLTFGGGFWTTEVQWWRLLGGGILVGIGTRLGKGCTSGHGVCGIGSASHTSFINVLAFVAVAVGTAHLVMALGVTP